MDVPEIPRHLLEELLRVQPSKDRGLEYRPCRARLRSGEVYDRVYVVEAGAYIRYWGVWPWEDRGKRALSITEVAHIEESPVRLPARLANTLYKAGESGMGYCLFTIVLRDGRRLPYATGNAVDFLDLPPDVRPEMVTRVLPHVGREHFQGRTPAPHTTGAPYYWCLYRNPAGV
jgi:hypothetical protein